MGFELMNELDRLKYNTIKENLTRRAAVSALQTYAKEPNKFHRLYKIERRAMNMADVKKNRLIPPAAQRGEMISLVSLVRIRDSQPLYDGLRMQTKPPGEILPDFTLGPQQYEDVCLEIFARAVCDENEDGDTLCGMFDKLFMSQGTMSKANAERLCKALDKDFPEDRDWPEVQLDSKRPPWR